MCGARPLYLSCGFILEEGFPVADLQRIVASMAAAAARAGVQIVTGDTKVVERGKADGCYITTAGVGLLDRPCALSAAAARPGDVVLVSGPIGDHGITVMLARGELDIAADIVSDTAPLHELTAGAARRRAATGVRLLRDATRGGVATICNEVAVASQVAVVLDESAVPVRPEVNGASELLGIDPLYVACEGRLVAVVAADRADDALAALRSQPARRRGGADRDGARRPARAGAAAHVVRRHPDRGPAGRRPAAPDLLSGHLLMHELAITESIVATVVERMPRHAGAAGAAGDRAAVRGGAGRRPVLLRPGDGRHDAGGRGAGDRRAAAGGWRAGGAAPSSTRTRCCALCPCGSADVELLRGPGAADPSGGGGGLMCGTCGCAGEAVTSGPGTATSTGTARHGHGHASGRTVAAGGRRPGQERRAGRGEPGVARAARDRRAEPDELARLGQDDAAGAHVRDARGRAAGVRAGGRPGDACSTPSGSARPGARVVQINTGAGCHLDADMVAAGAAARSPRRTGRWCSSRTSATSCARRCSTSASAARVVIMSVTEGADKPLKYPHMFRTADLVLLNKVDLLPYVDFDVAALRRRRPGGPGRGWRCWRCRRPAATGSTPGTRGCGSWSALTRRRRRRRDARRRSLARRVRSSCCGMHDGALLTISGDLRRMTALSPAITAGRGRRRRRPGRG